MKIARLDKKKPTHTCCCFQGTLPKPKGRKKYEVKLEKINGNINQKKGGLSILILADGVDFKLRHIAGDEESHFTVTNGSNHQEVM